MTGVSGRYLYADSSASSFDDRLGIFPRLASEGSVLLAFLAEATLKGDPLPPLGTSGPGHFGLGIEAETFDAGFQGFDFQPGS